MILRPYQTDSIKLLQSGFKKNRCQILCLPTGAGKTVIFSSMVELAAKNGTTTIVLTHRTELFEQTFRSIDSLGVTIQRIDAANKNIDSNALVSVAMVETLERRIKKGLDLMPKLIIIDEAHFGNFSKVIELFPSSYIIGVTATPVGKHFYKYYTQIVETITLSDLIKLKFLCDYKAYQMQDSFDDVKKSKGEFDENSLFEHFDKPKLYDGVIEKYIEKCNGKKAIVFNCNIEHSDNMTKAFNDAGIKSYSITSRTSKDDRKKILKEFDIGSFLVLNNCGILTTGFDCPSIEVVIVNRATLSLPLWLQMCGRGSRTFKDKTHFTVLDFGMNHNRHGMWNEDRIWLLKPPKEKKESAAPIKDCPECDAINYASARVCAVCGYEFIAKDKKAEVVDGVLVEVIKKSYEGKKLSELTTDELIILQKTGKYKAQFIWRIIRSNGTIKEYANKMGYSKGWIWRQEKETENNFKDYTV